jgi:hypothetical protein
VNKLVELIRRTDYLQDQVELVGRELRALREDLLQLEGRSSPPQADCFAVALALAQDLGTDFCSAQPHDLAERGNDWFVES